MSTELLVFHAVRLAGMARSRAVADRFDLDLAEANEILLDQQAFGHVTWHAFGSSAGWSLSAAGRAAGERLLAEELDAADARTSVERLYERFLPLNGRLRTAVTNWQIRPEPDDPSAPNRHRDAVWDSAVLAELGGLSRSLRPIDESLAALLPRFAGYSERFKRALERAVEGDREWVAGVGIDSCHTVWFELHEDFLATLGLAR